VKVLGFCLVLDWLCFERCNSGSNVFGIHAGGHGRLRFERRQFVLHLLSVFCANLDERVDRADRHVEADTLVKDLIVAKPICSWCFCSWHSTCRIKSIFFAPWAGVSVTSVPARGPHADSANSAARRLLKNHFSNRDARYNDFAR